MCAYDQHIAGHFLHTLAKLYSFSRVRLRGLSSPVKQGWILHKNKMNRKVEKTEKCAHLKKLHKHFALCHNWGNSCNAVI